MRPNYLLLTAFAIIFTLKPITGTGPSSPGSFPLKHGINQRNLATVSLSRRLSSLDINESLLIFRPAEIERFNCCSQEFFGRCWWTALLFLFPKQTEIKIMIHISPNAPSMLTDFSRASIKVFILFYFQPLSGNKFQHVSGPKRSLMPSLDGGLQLAAPYSLAIAAAAGVK